jgi:hypothetical protein
MYMAYWFQGFFVETGDDAVVAAVCDHVRDLWPKAIYRRISSPFQGLGVSRTEDGLTDHASTEHLDEQLGLWSRRFPALTIVRLEAVCFGTCDYGGAVWRNGHVLHQEPEQKGKAPLIRLLRFLGVESADGYFEPFHRGYFAPGP